MLPFTRVMNLYLIGFFSIAAIGVVLTLGVGIVEVIRYRRLHLAQAAMPTGDLGSGLDRKGDVGERRELNTWAAGSIVRFESRIVIQRPISQTFERLADLPGYAGWMHRDGLFRRSGLTSELPVRTGTTYFDSTWMGTFEGEVTEFVPPTRIAFRESLRWFDSPLTQARPEYSLEGDETATIVRHVAVGELYGWMRFMRPAAAWMANRERTRTLNSLKRSLECDSLRDG
jgi:uncharacterized protein YndB with AHSA1/START domain